MNHPCVVGRMIDGNNFRSTLLATLDGQVLAHFQVSNAKFALVIMRLDYPLSLNVNTKENQSEKRRATYFLVFTA